MYKNLLAIMAASLLSSVVYATPLTNVGGVIWDTDAPIDFQMQSNINLSNLDNGTLSGIGRITAINGSYNFCPGCELTFDFGYDLTALGNLDGDLNNIIEAVFNNGYVNFYVDAFTDSNFTDFNAESTSSATDGQLWLSTIGHSATGVGGIGELFVTLIAGTTFNSGASGSSYGLLDVIGGLAFENFDTNEQALGADLAFSGSFLPSNDGDALYPFIGTAEFSGSTVSVPEPNPLPLFLLGAMLLVGSRYNNKDKVTQIISK